MSVRVAVIGAGASGLFAAAQLVRLGASADIYERNDRVGKKLSITGKGRCNITNKCTPAQVFENVVTNPKFLFSAINSFTPDDVIEYFESIGVPVKVERGRRVFPVSDRANDVVSALQRDVTVHGGNIRLNTRVSSITPVDGGIELAFEGGKAVYDRVIVATGGTSYKGTGSTGDGYAFAQALGNKIITPRAALVPIYLKEDISELAGLSLKNVSVTISSPGKQDISLFGEMLFMHRGISGPIVLSLSSLCAGRVNGHGEFSGSSVFIDLKPALDVEKLDKRVLRDLQEGHTKAVKNVLPALMPKSLIPFVLSQARIAQDRRACDITSEERQRLVCTVKGLKFTPSHLGGIDEGIITSGGVDVKQIDPRDCSDKLSRGIYFIGEVLDVDALTGGYNLQIAFSTAYICAKSIAENHNFA